MTLKWSFNSIPLVGEDYTLSQEVKRGELFILGATASTFHFFGAGSAKAQLKGIVIGDTNVTSLRSAAVNDTSGVLISDQGSEGDFKINGTPKFERIKFAGGVIDGVAYSASTPIYRVELELIKVSVEHL